MGTMRLVLDACGCGMPVEVGIERLAELLARPDNRLWLDIRDPGPEDVALLQRVFGFHELALEDVTRPHERPRCDAYTGYYFIVVYAAEQAGDAIVPRELNLFWGENYLVTIHRGSSALLAVLAEARRRWEHHERLQVHGIACLAYTLFESLVDGYFVVQDRVREQIEGIEEAIFTGAEGAAANLFRLRKELLRVPRLLAPTSHVLAEVLRRESTVPGEPPALLRRRAGPRRARPGGARHLSRPAGRRARRPRLLGVQPAGPNHAAAHGDHRHHHGARTSWPASTA